ncbi:hypothetical protein [Egbenema bharatensis]|uniref:hypothetical protein n=1 Tax=Egbenema bharatensis TaxID=3463334 RepID=UPI003A84C171
MSEKNLPSTNDLLDERSLQETIAEPAPGSDQEIDGLPIDPELDVPPSQPGAQTAHLSSEEQANDP